MDHDQLQKLKLELAVQAKLGVDFILSAAITWGVITFVWTLSYSAYHKSIITFWVGAIMLPLAFLFSKVLKTKWKNPGNPLEPLGLWLNFAQLFYFPFLFFFLATQPNYFVMAYVIITGAHFFPYAWYYDEKGYAFSAGIISVGAFFIAINVEPANIYYVPLFMTLTLMVLVSWLLFSYRKKSILFTQVSQVTFSTPSR